MAWELLLLLLLLDGDEVLDQCSLSDTARVSANPVFRPTLIHQTNLETTRYFIMRGSIDRSKRR